jgi:ubiquinol-cytochrome c reductase cytochrome c subunit
VVVGVAVAGMLTSAAAAGPSSSATTGATSRLSSVQFGTPITYFVPTSPDQISAGQALFELNCASCHGPDASGTSVAPNLLGLGAATIDFWVSTGRMPLENASVQAVRKPPRFNRQQTLEIVAFVNSLQEATADRTGIPLVDTSGADLSQGMSLFVLNCAACHTITGSGDALANGADAPSLHRATKTQIAEAIRTGPGNMPWFGPYNLSDEQVADIVAYVSGPIQRPDNRGGLGLGGIGPVAEGFVGLLIGVGGLMLVAFWLGDRS